MMFDESEEETQLYESPEVTPVTEQVETPFMEQETIPVQQDEEVKIFKIPSTLYTKDLDEITAMSVLTRDSGAMLDSGASFIAVPSNFPLLQETENNITFSNASGGSMVSRTKGFINIMGYEFPAMKVEGLETPLLSVKSITDRGFNLYFTKDSVYAHDNSTNLPFYENKFWKLGEVRPDNTYRLCSVIAEEDKNKLYALMEASGKDLPTNFDEWSNYNKAIFLMHMSMGHKSAKLMVRERLIHSNDIDVIKSCNHCKITKHTNPPKVKQSHVKHSQTPHNRVHVDLYYSESLFQNVYRYEKCFVTVIVDDYSKYIQTAVTDSKYASKVSANVNKYISTYNNYWNKQLNEVKCDKGTEFNSIDTKLLQDGVILAPTNDKERNGTAERFVKLHKTMMDVITGYLHISLKAMFYEHAVQHASTLLNFSTKADAENTPYNLQHNQEKVLPKYLPIFLEDVLAQITLAGKLQNIIGTFLEYNPHTNMCQVLIQTPYFDKSSSVIEISTYKLRRTYKIYHAKLFITDARWAANEKVWGTKPDNWETTFFDLITNKEATMDSPQEYFNNHGIVLPEFRERDEYDDEIESRRAKGHTYAPLPKFTNISQSALQPLTVDYSTTVTDGLVFKLSQGNEDPKKPVDYDIDKDAQPEGPILAQLREDVSVENEETVTIQHLCSIVKSVSNVVPEVSFQVRREDTDDTGELEVIQKDSFSGMVVPKPPKKLDLNITGPWREPIMKEKQKYIDMQVFQPATSVPENGILLRPLWVYVHKPEKMKARLVCFNPKTVHQTLLMKSAPVVSAPAIQLLFTIAARQNQQVQFFDIDNAFLYADMPANKYFMVTPPIFRDVIKTKYVELNKSTYGLQESPRAFFDHLSQILTTKMGFSQHEMEPCLFYKDHSMLIAFHVDDGAIAGSPEDIAKFMEDIGKYFSFKRTTGSYLGIDVNTIDSEDSESRLLPIWEDAVNPTEDLSTISPTFHSGADPWDAFATSEIQNDDETIAKTSGYGKYKLLPQASEPGHGDTAVASQVPDPPPPGKVKFEFSMKTHIDKFLTKFMKDNPVKVEFLKRKPINYDALLKQFACPVNNSPEDFINSIDEYHGIPNHWKNTFKYNVSNQSLVGSLSYFIQKSVPSMTFAINVLSRYNRFPHRTVSYLLHCLVRDLLHMDTTIYFRQSNNKSDYLELSCFTDAAYSSATGAYQKGTVITMDDSLILYKSSIGKNKNPQGSTMQVELEAAFDSYIYLLRIINMLVTMKYKVNTFLYVDNLPLLKTFHNNNLAPSTTGNPKLKHIRNAILTERIRAGYVPGKANPADVFTKSFTTTQLKEYFTCVGNEYLKFEYNNDPKDLG